MRMTPLNLGKRLKQLRTAAGLSQAGLAQESGISMPTIQNLEAGKGNPALDTIKRVGKVLGFDLEIKFAKADWEVFAHCGAPITTLRRSRFISGNLKLDSGLLVQTVRSAALELFVSKGDAGIDPDFDRKVDALCAVLLALRTHYPRLFKSNFSRSKAVMEFASLPVTGRMIKLRRQALSRLGTYL